MLFTSPLSGSLTPLNKNRVCQPILSYRVDDSVKGSFGAEDGFEPAHIQLGKLTLYR